MPSVSQPGPIVDDLHLFLVIGVQVRLTLVSDDTERGRLGDWSAGKQLAT